MLDLNSEKIRIGIFGYGNLAKGVECAIKRNEDMELKAIFTRRKPELVEPATPESPIFYMDKVQEMKDDIDVMIVCAGSATDAPLTSPLLARMFCIVDSFDTHKNIPQHFENVDNAANGCGKVSLISAGWDPGLLSIIRAYGEAFLPDGDTYTFWGKGVSQGHSEAIRRLPGVVDAKQYTVPIPETVKVIRSGRAPLLTPREMHRRECYVVAEKGADKEKIRRMITTMPNYFADYDTTVNFVTQAELDRRHAKINHAGCIMRNGRTGFFRENKELMELKLKLDSNPEFTGSILVAYARAIYRMSQEGQVGARTVFDVPLSYLLPKDRQYMLRELL